MKPLKRQPRNLKVTSIDLWPVNLNDDSTAASTYSSFKNRYGNRRQFVLEEDVLSIDVWFTLVDSSLPDWKCKGRNHKLEVSLIDSDSRRCRVISTVHCRFRSDMYSAMNFHNHIHISLPIDYDEFSTSTNYKIRIAEHSTGRILAEEKFAIVSREEFDKFNDNHEFCYYRALRGGFVFKTEESAATHKVFDPLAHNYVTAAIWLETDGYILPELQVVVTDPEGNRSHHIVEPEEVFFAVETTRPEYDCFRVLVPIFVMSHGAGIYQVDLSCFGREVATMRGAAVPGCEIKGHYGIDGLTPDYSGSLDRRMRQWFFSIENAEVAEMFKKRLGHTFAATIDNSVPTELSDPADLPDSSGSEDVFEALLNDFINSSFVDDEPSGSTDDFHDSSFDFDDDELSESLNDNTDCNETIDDTDDADALDRLVGLGDVKRQLRSFKQMVIFNKRRADLGLPVTSLSLHTLFMGSPGTGKTTVAKILGQQLRQAGVLSKGHVVMRERATLLGQNYSSESENTIKALKEAEGGILFIDEAYQLYQPNDPRDPGRFVIESLLTAMADTGKRDWMLILAGYTEPMKRMLEINTGFRSRIPQSNIIVFDDYTREELGEIAARYFAEHKFALTPEAKDVFNSRLESDWMLRDDTFGNGRYVVNLIENEILPAMASRLDAVESPTALQLSTIEASDIRPTSAAVAQKRRRPVGFNHE